MLSIASDKLTMVYYLLSWNRARQPHKTNNRYLPRRIMSANPLRFSQVDHDVGVAFKEPCIQAAIGSFVLPVLHRKSTPLVEVMMVASVHLA